MKILTGRKQTITDHRRTLKKLVGELQKRPFDFLPERSVESLHQFFAGYGIFGPPVWRDLSSFQRWLTKRLSYPQDTDAIWRRYIQLNSKDKFQSYELFFQLYSEYLRQSPTDLQPDAQDFQADPATFDFYLHLYSVGRKPGLYLGSSDSVQLIAAYLAGYFKGKRDVALKLTRDEKEFLRFEEWMRLHHKYKKHYRWGRMVEMWPWFGLNSFEDFFSSYDAYLTDFGKKPRGLEDLFEVISDGKTTKIRRRSKRVLPKKPIKIQGSRRWWRFTSADAKALIQRSRSFGRRAKV